MKIGKVIIAATLTFAALPVRAETIEIFDDRGGHPADYAMRWATHRRNGVHVRIAGPCHSECTMLLGQIPRDRICVTPEASFGFHRADVPATTAVLWKSYPTDIYGSANTAGSPRMCSGCGRRTSIASSTSALTLTLPSRS